MFDKDEHVNDILELDMKFDKTLPIYPEVLIRLDLRDNSLEGIGKVLTDAHNAFVDHDYKYRYNYPYQVNLWENVNKILTD